MGEFWELYNIAGKQIPKHKVVIGMIGFYAATIYGYSKYKSMNPTPVVYTEDEKAFIDQYLKRAKEDSKKPAYVRGELPSASH